MSPQGKENITAELIEKLAEVAGVTLEPGRQEALTTLYRGFLEGMERLQELDIDDEEPATVFLAGEYQP